MFLFLFLVEIICFIMLVVMILFIGGGGGIGGICVVVGVWVGNVNMDVWCVLNCVCGNCLFSFCKCI